MRDKYDYNAIYLQIEIVLLKVVVNIMNIFLLTLHIMSKLVEKGIHKITENQRGSK